MKPRAGNHTSARQWVYLVVNPTLAIFMALAIALSGAPAIWVAMLAPWFVLTKIGITGSLAARSAQVKKTSPGLDLFIPIARIPGAYQVEQLAHRCLFFLRARWYGSGKTEWFVGLWGPPAMLAAWAVRGWIGG